MSLDLALLAAPLAPFLPLPWLLAAASNVGKASSFQPDHTALLATWENVGVPDCTRKRSSTTSDHNRRTPEDTRPSESKYAPRLLFWRGWRTFAGLGAGAGRLLDEEDEDMPAVAVVSCFLAHAPCRPKSKDCSNR